MWGRRLGRDQNVVEVPWLAGLRLLGLAVVVYIYNTLAALSIGENLLGSGTEHGVGESENEEAEGKTCPQRPVLESENGGSRRCE